MTLDELETWLNRNAFEDDRGEDKGSKIVSCELLNEKIHI